MGKYAKDKQKRPKIDKTLKEIIPDYWGKVVRIGTDGSGYYVCGKLDDELLADLEYWETEAKARKRTVIERMEAQLEDLLYV